MIGFCRFCHSRNGPGSGYRRGDPQQPGRYSSRGPHRRMAPMADPTALPHIASRLERQQLKRLEVLSLIEATTLVLLVCIAAPLKHALGWPLGSRILGPVHGIAFIAYTWTALQTVSGGGWRGREIARLFIVALLPFAGYVNIPWLRRKAAALDGRGAHQPS
jgi:integral membrane protein